MVVQLGGGVDCRVVVVLVVADASFIIMYKIKMYVFIVGTQYNQYI